MKKISADKQLPVQSHFYTVNSRKSPDSLCPHSHLCQIVCPAEQVLERRLACLANDQRFPEHPAQLVSSHCPGHCKMVDQVSRFCKGPEARHDEDRFIFDQ